MKAFKKRNTFAEYTHKKCVEPYATAHLNFCHSVFFIGIIHFNVDLRTKIYKLILLHMKRFGKWIYKVNKAVEIN